MTVVRNGEPPQPKEPGIYTRIVVKTLYHGTWYSTWTFVSKLTPLKDDDFDLEQYASKVDSAAALLESIKFQNAQPEDKGCDAEYVILTADLLRTSVIKVQKLKIKKRIAYEMAR